MMNEQVFPSHRLFSTPTRTDKRSCKTNNLFSRIVPKSPVSPLFLLRTGTRRTYNPKLTVVAIKRGNPELVHRAKSPEKQKRTDPLLAITTNRPSVIRMPIEMELEPGSEDSLHPVEEICQPTMDMEEPTPSEDPSPVKQIRDAIQNEEYSELQDHFSNLVRLFQECGYKVRDLCLS